MKYLFSTFLIVTSISAIAQGTTRDNTTPEELVNAFFFNMNSGDTTLMRSWFLPNATLVSIHLDENNKTTKVSNGSFNSFISFIGSPKLVPIKEIVHNITVDADPIMASARMDYVFYNNNRVSHCGINKFNLINTASGWKIQNITDTRRAHNCTSIEKNKSSKDHKLAINQLLNDWHKAAAKGDEDVFFGNMTDNAIYLGTDPSEIWTKTEFMSWSKKYFDRDKGWDFTPLKRHIIIDNDEQTAWFHETLDTWMGVCRGSGVLQKIDNSWQLAQFDLSLTIPNKKMKKVKKIAWKK